MKLVRLFQSFGHKYNYLIKRFVNCPLIMYLYLFMTLVLFCGTLRIQCRYFFDYKPVNNRPIIGILTHELSYKNPLDSSMPTEMEYNTHYRSYIAASYVKFVEAAGARVIPIWINRTESYYWNIINSINGVLWPGGAAEFDVPDGYAAAGYKIYKIASDLNKKGDYFPIWGTCLGLELMTYVAADQREHRADCVSYNDAVPLDFTPDFHKSKLFGNAPGEILNILATQRVTVNFHHYCVTAKNMTKLNLLKDWHILSNNVDSNDLEFVSTLEHRVYPFYGVMFHPEKNAFEWKLGKNHPHFADAITASQYFAQFFVNEARKSEHKFSSQSEEISSLIYNFPVTYTGSRWVFEQCYFFG